MSDYHTLIAQAIDGLDENNTEEARRALYERARSAQIRQLRAIRPPLSESVVAKERLSLENAIRKVETNAARKSGSKPSEQRPAPSPRRDAVREESDQPEQIEQSPIAFGEGGARRPAPPPSARPPTSLILKLPGVTATPSAKVSEARRPKHTGQNADRPSISNAPGRVDGFSAVAAISP